MSNIYSNKFVVCLLVNGKQLQSNKRNEVNIKFDSEYVIKLINKNNIDSVSEVYIDGNFIGNFKVAANKSIEIKTASGNNKAFKFVKSSKEEYEESQNGIIECRFKLEENILPHVPYVPYIPPYNPLIDPPYHPYRPYDVPYEPNKIWCGGPSPNRCNFSVSSNSNGKTVDGSIINTKSISYNEDYTVLKAFLIGIENDDESEKNRIELERLDKQINSLLAKKNKLKNKL